MIVNHAPLMRVSKPFGLTPPQAEFPKTLESGLIEIL
jgi:hypothetical protein